MKKALIIYGGWEGHDPKESSDIVSGQLKERGFEVELSDTLDRLTQGDLKQHDLIIMMWTMGKIEREQLTPLLEAVRSGVGLAGWHGGLCDAFRMEVEYQFMTGGQWVAHPGGVVPYDVYITEEHPITDGVPRKFHMESEQYYMHVDPAVQVLGVTLFGDVQMPIAWIKRYGKGRVFYTSLGHVKSDVAQAEPLKLIVQGCVWASEKDGDDELFFHRYPILKKAWGLEQEVDPEDH
jgi:hypothetical protein